MGCGLNVVNFSFRHTPAFVCTSGRKLCVLSDLALRAHSLTLQRPFDSFAVAQPAGIRRNLQQWAFQERLLALPKNLDFVRAVTV
jgi:hypothetical protein